MIGGRLLATGGWPFVGRAFQARQADTKETQNG
jgi:hypothetical protein